MKLKSSTIAFICCLAGLVLFTAFCRSTGVQRAATLSRIREAADPGSINHISQFSARFPEVERAYEIRRDGQRFVVLMTPIPNVERKWHVPSGPPAYVFDSKGNLSYWTTDIGDDPRFWKEWSIEESTKMSTGDVEAFVESLSKNGSDESAPATTP